MSEVDGLCRWDEITEGPVAHDPERQIAGDPSVRQPKGSEPPGPTEKRPRRRLGPGAQLLGAALLSLVTAVSTLLGTLFIVFPDLKRESPPALGATLSDVALEERAVPVAGGVANIISYEIEFTGYKKKRASIKYAVFDAVRQRRIDPPVSDDPAAAKYLEVGPIIPEAPNDRASANFLVPIPARAAQCVFVRVYVFEEDDAVTRLDYADTPSFDTHSSTDAACADLLTNTPAT